MYFTILAQVKDDNNVTKKSCQFYELDLVLGTRAASSPPVLIDSGIRVVQDGSSTPVHATSDCTQGTCTVRMVTINS